MANKKNPSKPDSKFDPQATLVALGLLLADQLKSGHVADEVLKLVKKGSK